MTDRRLGPEMAIKGSHLGDADKEAATAKPNEARMSEIAKRLLSTPPAKQGGNRVIVKRAAKAE